MKARRGSPDQVVHHGYIPSLEDDGPCKALAWKIPLVRDASSNNKMIEESTDKEVCKEADKGVYEEAL